MSELIRSPRRNFNNFSICVVLWILYTQKKVSNNNVLLIKRFPRKKKKKKKSKAFPLPDFARTESAATKYDHAAKPAECSDDVTMSHYYIIRERLVLLTGLRSFHAVARSSISRSLLDLRCHRCQQIRKTPHFTQVYLLWLLLRTRGSSRRLLCLCECTAETIAFLLQLQTIALV